MFFWNKPSCFQAMLQQTVTCKNLKYWLAAELKWLAVYNITLPLLLWFHFFGWLFGELLSQFKISSLAFEVRRARNLCSMIWIPITLNLRVSGYFDTIFSVYLDLGFLLSSFVAVFKKKIKNKLLRGEWFCLLLCAVVYLLRKKKKET